MADKNSESGKKQNWFLRHKIISVVLGLIILIIIGSAMSGGNKTPSSSQSTAGNNQAEAVEAVKITAVKLSEEYDANKVAADAKYKGKTLEVSGTINDIGKDIMDDPYVVLQGRPNGLFGIQCMFDKSDEQKLVDLSKNQKITLTGKVSGELIGNVILKNCSIAD